MAQEQAVRDQNYVTSMLFKGSDGLTHNATGDETTGRLKVDLAGSSSGLTVGTTTITSGTTTRILYNNAEVLGEYTITGSGTVVAMATSPVFITPTLGVASATSINKVAITAPATSATLTIADGKTFTANDNVTVGTGGIVLGNSGGLTVAASKVLTVNKSITLDGTDATTMTFPSTSATIARTNAGQTFTGVQNFTSPDVTTSITTASTSFTAFAGATTLLTIGGTGASASLFAPSTLDTSSSTTGAIRTSGGISAAKSANIGTTLTVGTGYQIGGAAASGKILKGNGTNFVASTETYAAPGTSGNVMTSDGTNWTSAAPAGGSGWSLVYNGTFSGATTATINNNGSNLAGDTDEIYMLVVRAVWADGAEGVLQLRFNADSSANYYFATPYLDQAGTPSSTTGSGDTKINITNGGFEETFTTLVLNTKTARKKMVTGNAFGFDTTSNTFRTFTVGGLWEDTSTAITAFTLVSTANFASGSEYWLYKKS